MKRAYILAGVALFTALVITLSWRIMPVEDRLAEFHLKKALPEFADSLLAESPDIQWLMLEYSDDRLLLLKTQAALLKYPDLAREVLPVYGYEPEFQAVLSRYGEQVLLPVHYFLNNEVWTVSALHFTSTKYREAKDAAGRTFSKKSKTDAIETSGSEASEVATETLDKTSGLTEIQRGWYAVNYIESEGYDFLGQFVSDETGQPRWVQSERFIEGATGFFTGGIRDLESKWRADEERTLADYGWAGLDLVFIGAGLKLARTGKSAATATKATVRTARTTAKTRAATRLVRMRSVLAKTWQWTKFPLQVGAVALVITNPSLIHDAFAMLADLIGLPAWLVQLLGWSLILFPVIFVLSKLYGLLVRPLVFVLLRVVAELKRTIKIADPDPIKAYE